MEILPNIPPELPMIARGVLINLDRVAIYEQAAQTANEAHGNPELFHVIIGDADLENGLVEMQLLGAWLSRPYRDASEFWEVMRSIEAD